ncbi:MAG: permease [Halothiobacillus sp.]
MTIAHIEPTPFTPAVWCAWVWPIILVTSWFVVYWNLQPVTDALMRWTPLNPHSHLFNALAFLVFELPKVLLLLALITFVAGVVQTFFTPEKTRALLAGCRAGVGNVMAAMLGIVTPFCSCSAIPLFIGFLTAGVPLGVTDEVGLCTAAVCLGVKQFRRGWLHRPLGSAARPAIRSLRQAVAVMGTHRAVKRTWLLIVLEINPKKKRHEKTHENHSLAHCLWCDVRTIWP